MRRKRRRNPRGFRKGERVLFSKAGPSGGGVGLREGWISRHRASRKVVGGGREYLIVPVNANASPLWVNDGYGDSIRHIGRNPCRRGYRRRAGNPRKRLTVEVWRRPTKGEIKFGYGSLHYKTITVSAPPRGGQKFKVDGQTWTYGSRHNPCGYRKGNPRRRRRAYRRVARN
jgi:hypothetical protein